MFEIGFWELVVVGVVALWVLGPERLPAVARVCGRWLLRAKYSYQAVKNEFIEEFQQHPPTHTNDEKTAHELTIHDHNKQ